MANLVLMNYQGEKADTGFSIDDLSNVLRIDITVVTGDEIATIIFKNGEKMRFDSADVLDCLRRTDFYDYEYCLFNSYDGTNKFEAFNNRSSSYDLGMEY